MPDRRCAPLQESQRARRHAPRREESAGGGRGRSSGEKWGKDDLRALKVVQRARVKKGARRVVFAALLVTSTIRILTFPGSKKVTHQLPQVVLDTFPRAHSSRPEPMQERRVPRGLLRDALALLLRELLGRSNELERDRKAFELELREERSDDGRVRMRAVRADLACGDDERPDCGEDAGRGLGGEGGDGAGYQG